MKPCAAYVFYDRKTGDRIPQKKLTNLWLESTSLITLKGQYRRYVRARKCGRKSVANTFFYYFGKKSLCEYHLEYETSKVKMALRNDRRRVKDLSKRIQEYETWLKKVSP